MQSIRRLMLVALIGTLSVVLSVAGLFSYRAALQEAGEMFDAKLAHSARVLVSLVDEPLGELSRTGDPLTIRVWHGAAAGVGDDLARPLGHAYETKLAFQVRDGDGRLLLRSDSGPQAPFVPLRPGYGEVLAGGETWRTFTLRAPSGRWFQAGERSDIREELAGDIAFGTLVPLLVALPLMALVVWLVVDWVLRDVVALAEELERRTPGALVPLPVERAPSELRGVVSALNGLMARLDTTLQRERRFTADVAHELRTPIAALKVHADNLRGAVDDAERAESQSHLDLSVGRLDRLVAQLLSLNRVDDGAGLRVRVPVDLDSIVRQEAAAQQAVAKARGIAVDVSTGPARLAGDPPALESLVRNLVDNAVRYAPEGGHVRIRLTADGDVARLVVEDDGPGIAEEARQRVFDRFHRELGTGVEGTGLGLAIVRSVAGQHGGAVALGASDDLGGLRVVAEFPMS